MEIQPEPQPSRLEDVKVAITTAGEDIADTLKTSPDSWVGGLGQVLFAMETSLLAAGEEGELTPEEYAKYQQRMEALKAEKQRLGKAFPTRAKSPDPETQERILRRLDIFDEDLYRDKDKPSK